MLSCPGYWYATYHVTHTQTESNRHNFNESSITPERQQFSNGSMLSIFANTRMQLCNATALGQHVSIFLPLYSVLQHQLTIIPAPGSSLEAPRLQPSLKNKHFLLEPKWHWSHVIHTNNSIQAPSRLLAVSTLYAREAASKHRASQHSPSSPRRSTYALQDKSLWTSAKRRGSHIKLCNDEH